MRLGHVPRGDSRFVSPRGYVQAGPWPRDTTVGPWPRAVLTDHHGAKVAQALALRLTSALEGAGWSVAELSRRSGVSRLTIANVLAGRVWPDLLTVASLERALECDLWPGRDV